MKHIPNILTLTNLLFGSLAIVFLFQGAYYYTFWFFVGCLFMDFSDGLVARALKVKSEIGKQLDSLSDMVSFGVLPGMILYHILALHQSSSSFLPYSGFIFTITAAYRLAKFNIDSKQTINFRGLNTPTASAFVIGLMMLNLLGLKGYNVTLNGIQFMVLSSIIILSGLMVSNVNMFSGKFDGLSWLSNKILYIFAALSIMLLVTLGYVSFIFIVLSYIILSIISNFIKI